jgi:hypothetical protein
MQKYQQKDPASKLSRLMMALIVCSGFHGMAYAGDNKTAADNITEESSSADVGKSQSGGTSDTKKNMGRLRSSTTDAFGSTNANGNVGDPDNSTQSIDTKTSGKVQSNSLSASSGVERSTNMGETAGEWSGTKGKNDPNARQTTKQ